MIFDPSYLLVIPAIVFTMWAQWKVKSAYTKYSQLGVRSGMTGADIARLMMRNENIEDVELETVAGEMTDHYDPIHKTVRLSEAVYHGTSIAALGIAAHEVGHVIQHARGYAPLALRTYIYPVANLGSGLGNTMIFLGFMLSAFGAAFGSLVLTVGIWLFAGFVAFTLITLPVEFDASRRAVRALSNGDIMTEEELGGARSVLNAAAMTYVASAAVAVMTLLHFLIASRDR
jgi:Zn-dependent membrane protease YugP